MNLVYFTICYYDIERLVRGIEGKGEISPKVSYGVRNIFLCIGTSPTKRG